MTHSLFGRPNCITIALLTVLFFAYWHQDLFYRIFPILQPAFEAVYAERRDHGGVVECERHVWKGFLLMLTRIQAASHTRSLLSGRKAFGCFAASDNTE